MPKGYLRIQVMSASYACPIKEAMIRIYQDVNDEIINESFHTTDNMGVTEYIALETVDVDLSCNKKNTPRPYSLYHVEIRCEEYETLEIINVQIFANNYSTLPINLTYTPSNEHLRNLSYVPEHTLFTMKERKEKSFSLYSLNHIKIPKKVIVHMGIPSSNAENIEVDFIPYLKNVASNEIYPTWEEAAIRANVHCFISLLLSRVFSNWYPNKGYDFDITNTEIYDQTFVLNRNIYDNISEIVDEIFNEYFQIEKDKEIQIFDKWESQSLALKGYSDIKILQQLYGENIHLITCNYMEGVHYTYPGTPLCKGMKSSDILLIQKQLNTISSIFPAIAFIDNIEGFFDESTKNTIKAFQKQFNLKINGIINKSTWYKVFYIYDNIQKFNESKINKDKKRSVFPFKIIEMGAKSIEVKKIQDALNVVGIIFSKIPVLVNNGIYEEETKQAIQIFQKIMNLTPTDIIDKETWNMLFMISNDISNGNYPSFGLPSFPSNKNLLEKDKTFIQKCISFIFRSYRVSIENNESATIQKFQSMFGLQEDGFINEQTWCTINKVYKQLID